MRAFSREQTSLAREAAPEIIQQPTVADSDERKPWSVPYLPAGVFSMFRITAIADIHAYPFERNSSKGFGIPTP